MALLKEEFPGREFIHFEGYNITYPEGRGMVWKMGVAAPRILNRIAAESDELDVIITDQRIDGVISDNRFGLFSERVPCVYITHQVMIKSPIFEPRLYKMHMRYMEEYTEVWVPDHAREGLSGDLGHKQPLPSQGHYIGPLSRFMPSECETVRDVLVLISGPEPQRTRFETMVLSQLEQFDGSAMAVLGTPEVRNERVNGRGHRIVPHLPATQLEQAIKESRLIISRSGYSTIMDLSVLGKKAVFVPTPGQTEQEYLGKVFEGKGQHVLMKQGEFNLREAWSRSVFFKGFAASSSDSYKSHVERFVGRL